MPDSCKEVDIYAENHLVLTSSLSVCIYFDFLDRELSESLLHLWNLLVPIFEPNIRWYFTDQMAEKQEIDADTFKIVPAWLRTSEPTRAYYVFRCQGGQDPLGVNPWNIELWITKPEKVKVEARPLMTKLFNISEDQLDRHTNCLRISFPCNFKKYNIDKIFSLSNFILEKMPFIHGYAGPGLIFDNTSNLLKREEWLKIIGIVFRYPGYDIFDYTASEAFVYDRIRTVNWLTFLGPTIGKKFRNADREQYISSEDIKIYEKNNKLLIQAGSIPLIGDVNRNDRLPLYREVAKAVEPFLCEAHWPIGFMDEEKMMLWLRRFYED